MKVLVTGGTGYLGGRIVLALVHASYEVRALVRKTSNVKDIPQQVELAYGDVRDVQSLVAAFEGCDAVIHTGAMVSSWSPTPSLYYKVNVEGLENVIEALKHAPTVKKLIYTSSYFAVGPTGDQPVDESQVHPGKDFTSDYEKSKYLADIVARDAANEGVPIVMLYPGTIYGPGKLTAGNLIADILIERFNGRIPGYSGPGNDRNPFCNVDDVAYGHLAALDRGRVGERYFLCGEALAINDVLNFAADFTETSRPRFTIPLWFLAASGHALAFFARLFKFMPVITPEAVAVMRKKWVYSSEKARQELGYESRPFKEGLAEVLVWLKDLSLIKY
ncbi:hypothetical protein R1flu_016803 [Riccia fluitans]|uniref:NAD-dependent epimerase/dehydratase domain-containing protein n=1 Tax=Riccia fluitans TaxID=41844 RepID=A0ABD1YMW0_9MARC